MKSFYAAVALMATLGFASTADAMPNDPDTTPGDAAFCNRYAFSTKQFVDGILARKPSCLDYSKGVHGDYQMHYSWCQRTPRTSVEGAARNIRNLGNRCIAASAGGNPGPGNFNGGGSNFGGRGNGGGSFGGGNRGGGATDPAFCQNYAQGMVALGAEAARRSCLQYGPQGLHTNYQSHYNWCLGKSRAAVQGAAARINGLLASCNR